jgi:hypothetical protein
MRVKSLYFFTILLLFSSLNNAYAFCGFYVAKASSNLFNQSSQVVMVRDGTRNIVTMSSDFKGNVNEFAMVMPVPTVLKREQIHVTNNKIIEHLDSYSAPRLVEYFDENPCSPPVMYKMMPMAAPAMESDAAAVKKRARSLGVTIEAQYTVGEYDIMLLSAQQSGGLLRWLTEQGYKLPQGAETVVGSYLKQKMKFFVAKVNLKKFNQSGYTRLRPIQIAYDYSRFMLPIRLGTVNSQGQQELFIYALSRQGRIETTNYRTVKLPSDIEIPSYIKTQNKFADFYRDMFRTQVKKNSNKAVFLEYAWDMNWCDPCAADPLSNKELRELGVFWVNEESNNPQTSQRRRPPLQGQNVYLSRLHVRYDRHNFPEDLLFQNTGNRENFQGRYIIRHAWKGTEQCSAANQYFESLGKRQNQRAKNLSNLTGWNINDIQKTMQIPARPASSSDEGMWWKDLWSQ